jgi:hypothetical protein
MKSEMEVMFVDWLEEAKDAGLVEDWEYEPESFPLTAKAEYEAYMDNGRTYELLKPSSYTPDFAITLTDLGQRLLMPVWRKGIHRMHNGKVMVDVKGEYDPRRNDDRFISIVRKMVYEKYGFYVEIMNLPYTFFGKTWSPDKYRWMKKKHQLNKLGRITITLQDYIHLNGIQLELL